MIGFAIQTGCLWMCGNQEGEGTMSLDEGSIEHLLIKHLIANIKCAVCQHHYKAEDIQIVDHRDDIWVMAVICRQCRTHGLIFAIIKEAIPAITEMSPGERAKFKKMPQIEADEILDVHRLLENFDGGFVELLQDEWHGAEIDATDGRDKSG